MPDLLRENFEAAMGKVPDIDPEQAWFWTDEWEKPGQSRIWLGGTKKLRILISFLIV